MRHESWITRFKMSSDSFLMPEDGKSESSGSKSENNCSLDLVASNGFIMLILITRELKSALHSKSGNTDTQVNQ